jgi:protein-tyrosine phosphatase
LIFHKNFHPTTVSESESVSESELFFGFGSSQNIRIISDSDPQHWFQAEFEALPETCSDRTTTACDLPCNRPKNRYPDIKAYDQTRVRLSTAADSAAEGSDYINANFVVGYKERKRWICAQGPLVGTLEDFWRMIHEQGVELIIMLTNLEEYNRIKCAQYWPGAGQSTFGQLRVSFVQERRYSDFVVRELKVTHGEGGRPRQIFHYHYLQWKGGGTICVTKVLKD